MSNLALYAPAEDPANLGYPPTFPVEVALKIAPIKELCEDHGISRAQWNALRQDPHFIAHLTVVTESLKKEGMSFRLKARLQSEELLKTSWALIHAQADEVPSNVKADLIKFTWRVAGLDYSQEQKAQATAMASNTSNLQININL